MYSEVTDIGVVQARRTDAADRERISAVAAQPIGPRRSEPDMFEEQARLRPNAVAIKAQSSQITYGELNRWANRVGRAIIERIGSDQEPVAVTLGNDIGHMAVMLGVMKSNNIVLALNPDDPPDRAAQILGIAGAKLFIANEAWLANADDFAPDGVEIMRFENLGADLPDTNLGLDIDPESYARLIFTSGSTGAPKGVPKEHWKDGHGTLHPYSKFGPEDKVAQLAPPSFAAAPAFISYALLGGGTLCLYDVRKEGLHRLAEWINDNQITVLGMVPSLFRRLLEMVPEGVTFPTVRLVTAGGEALLKGERHILNRLVPIGQHSHHRKKLIDLLLRFLPTDLPLRVPEQQRQPDVVKGAHIGKQLGDLECARHPSMTDLMRLHAGNIFTLELDRA